MLDIGPNLFRCKRSKHVWPFFLVSFFITGCTSVFYQPDRFLYSDPSKQGIQKQDVIFHSKDGTRLLAWYFPPPPQMRETGTIVQFHGNAENISTHSLTLAWLAQQGYGVFSFDYRGYGASQGDPTPEGVYQDSLAALDEAWKKYSTSPIARTGKKRKKLIVIGQSLGGAIALRALQDWTHKDQVDLLILDSTFLSYKTVARRKLASHWVTWLFSPLGYLLVSDKYSPKEQIGKNTIPLLVIHDQRDPVIPFDLGEEIYELAGGKKEFWKLDQGRHIGVFSEDNPEWRKKFVEFLNADSLFGQRH